LVTGSSGSLESPALNEKRVVGVGIGVAVVSQWKQEEGLGIFKKKRVKMVAGNK